MRHAQTTAFSCTGTRKKRAATPCVIFTYTTNTMGNVMALLVFTFLFWALGKHVSLEVEVAFIGALLLSSITRIDSKLWKLLRQKN